MRSSLLLVSLAVVAGAALLPSCTRDIGRGNTDASFDPREDAGFRCLTIETQACSGEIHDSCMANGEFLEPVHEDCAATGRICVENLWCVRCVPDTQLCDGNNVVMCSHDGSAVNVLETCDISMGFTCRDGACVNLCDEAIRQRSYLGCEFFATDLDNAALGVQVCPTIADFGQEVEIFWHSQLLCLGDLPRHCAAPPPAWGAA